MRLSEHPTIEFEDDWYFTERWIPYLGGDVRLVLDPKRRSALAVFSRYETYDVDSVDLPWGGSPVQWAHIVRAKFGRFG
jgi:hypothetical protein